MTTRAQATAASMPINLNGKQYQMSPLEDIDLGALDNWVRGRAIEAAKASVSASATQEEKDEVFDRALRVSMSMTWASDTGAGLLATVSGMSQFIWQGIKKNHPEMTVEEVERGIVSDPEAIGQGLEVFRALNEDVQKKRPLKDNSTDEAQKARRKQKQQKKDRKRNRRR